MGGTVGRSFGWHVTDEGEQFWYNVGGQRLWPLAEIESGLPSTGT